MKIVYRTEQHQFKKSDTEYKFLDTLGYASDPNYLDKVKVITEKYL